jgi:hypothetical protein
MTRYSTEFETDIQTSWVQRWGCRWSQFMAVVLSINMLLVLFNLTYVPLRSLYLTSWPAVVQVYDPVKGIEPHPVTQTYLQTIREARSRIAQTDFQDAALAPVLTSLQQQSVALIEENPFQEDSQAANFARLKRRIRRETGASSAQVGLQRLWQPTYLNETSWPHVDDFLRSQVEPLLQQNYYREGLPTGQPQDDFWRLDLIFILFFGSELLVRTFLLSAYSPGVSWGDVLARRWYEVPLLLPFWRWLRVIPTAIRFHRSQLVDIERWLSQVTHEPAAYLSDRVAKYIIVRLLNEAQTFIVDGRLLDVWQRHPHYTTIGKPEKVEQITDRLLQLIVMRVMPTVKPDIEQLLRHSLQRALVDSDVYASLYQVPGFGTLPDEALNGIAEYLSEATCDVLTSSYTDAEGRVILDQLSSDFRQALGHELRDKANSEALQSLITDLIEELKVNYVQRSPDHPPEATLQEVNHLHQTMGSSTLTD